MADAEAGWRDAWVRTGAFDLDEFNADSSEIIGVFGGYCYLNVSLARVFGHRAPGMTAEDMDTALFGVMPGVPPFRPQPGDDSPEHTVKIGETLTWVFTTTDLPEVRADEQVVDQLRRDRPDFSSMSADELLDHSLDLFDAHFRHLFMQHLYISFLASIPLGVISAVCTAVGEPALALKLVAGVGDVESSNPSRAMWKLGRTVAGSRELTRIFEGGPAGLHERLKAAGSGDADGFLADFDRFLLSYGSRGPNEWESRCPTWETEPDLALAAIDRMRLAPDDADPDRQTAARGSEREVLSAEILAKLEGVDAETHAQMAGALHAAPLFLAGRERTKTNCVKLIEECRMALREMGRRIVAEGRFDEATDYAFLAPDDVRAVIAGADMRDVIAVRKADYEELTQRREPFVFEMDCPPPSTWPRKGEGEISRLGAGDSATGMPGCPGQARGIARVVLDSHDPTALAPGDVLVAPITDPSWTPLFVGAAAVVVNVGAPLSHAVIVSRELGIPCVTSLTDATDRIPDGALVEVDGDTGTVTILSL
jgi:rifampicin phosphotransferase